MRDYEHDYEDGYDPEYDGAELIDALDDVDDDESLYLDEADRASRVKRHFKTAKMRGGPDNRSVLRTATKDLDKKRKRHHRAAMRKVRWIGKRQVKPVVSGVLATLGASGLKGLVRKIEVAFVDAATHAARKAITASTPGQIIAVPITAIVTTVARKALRPKFGSRTDKIVSWIQLALDAVIPAVATLSSEDEDEDFELDDVSFEEDDGFDFESGEDDDIDDFDELLPASDGTPRRNQMQTRTCSRSLRRAARHLLRVERQLGARPA